MRTTRLLESYCPPDLDVIGAWAENGQVDRILHDMLERGGTTPWEELPPEFLLRALEVVGQQGPDYVVAAAFNTMLSHAYSLVVHRLFFLERHLRAYHHRRCGQEIYSYHAMQILDLYERAVEQFLRLVRAYTTARKSLELPDLTEFPTGLGAAAPDGPVATATATDSPPEKDTGGRVAAEAVHPSPKAMDTSEKASPDKKPGKRSRPVRRSA